MYRKGKGVEKDEFMAYTFFSSGIDSGDLECHAEMALSYISSDNIIEAAISLTSYFELTPTAEINMEYAYFYLILVEEYGIRLRHTDKLSCIKHKLVRFIENLIENGDDDEETVNTIKFIKRNIHDNSLECDATLNFELSSNYKYGLNNCEVDFNKSSKYLNKYSEIDKLNEIEKLRSKYYFNDDYIDNISSFFEWTKEGIELGDINCFASLAMLNQDIDEDEEALQYWGKYFSSATNNIEPLFAIEYLFFAYETNNNLLYKKEVTIQVA